MRRIILVLVGYQNKQFSTGYSRLSVCIDAQARRKREFIFIKKDRSLFEKQPVFFVSIMYGESI
jgi:hypothetical protein